ncbi:ABC transporter ATP-binding protein [Apibacter sp. HY039]|uniref:ABC transporter ATP-binding protein n=1 Tax=Apibacter sp. HY039 TaxID=2501476 RepID=UPI001C8757DB|nr:ABC transporter ATP-binding protein [Apibacter sp. HY039]
METIKIELRQAELGYKKSVVLKNLNVELLTNSTVCLLGKNGAGKTTLFKSILGILPTLSGSININGKNIAHWNRNELARHIAYIPQAKTLPFPFSVFEVVLFGRTAYLSQFSSPSKKDKIIADACLEQLNIMYLKNRIFTHLSGGEQQMVIIARALAQQPSFLIMDEPTSSLDFGNQIKIIQEVNNLRNEKMGIFMATHNPDHAFMCDADVLVVHEGTLWKQGYCNDILTNETLKQIYGVDIDVIDLKHNDKERKICIPAYKS